jgi:hypothetical protein
MRCSKPFLYHLYEVVVAFGAAFSVLPGQEVRHEC